MSGMRSASAAASAPGVSCTKVLLGPPPFDPIHLPLDPRGKREQRRELEQRTGGRLADDASDLAIELLIRPGRPVRWDRSRRRAGEPTARSAPWCRGAPEAVLGSPRRSWQAEHVENASFHFQITFFRYSRPSPRPEAACGPLPGLKRTASSTSGSCSLRVGPSSIGILAEYSDHSQLATR